MISSLFPDMALHAFQPLRDRLAEERPEGDFTPHEVRDLLAACALGAAVLERLGDMLPGRLCGGVERQTFLRLVQEFMEVADMAEEWVYPWVRAIVTRSTLPADECAAGLRALDDLAARAQGQREPLAAIQRWLQTPAPTRDLSALLCERESAGPSGFEDIGAILTRIRTGGEV